MSIINRIREGTRNVIDRITGRDTPRPPRNIPTPPSSQSPREVLASIDREVSTPKGSDTSSAPRVATRDDSSKPSSSQPPTSSSSTSKKGSSRGSSSSQSPREVLASIDREVSTPESTDTSSAPRVAVSNESRIDTAVDQEIKRRGISSSDSPRGVVDSVDRAVSSNDNVVRSTIDVDRRNSFKERFDEAVEQRKNPFIFAADELDRVSDSAFQRGDRAERSGKTLRAVSEGGLSGTAGFGALIFTVTAESVTKTFPTPFIGSSTDVLRDISNDPFILQSIPAGLQKVGDDIGSSLQQNPITSGSKVITEIVLPGGILKSSQRISTALAPFRSDFATPTSFQARNVRVTSQGVTSSSSSDVFIRVPTGTGAEQTIIFRGGAATTAEDLATQFKRAGSRVDAVTAQDGLIPPLSGSGTKDLRAIQSLDDTLFADPASRLRTSRLGLNNDIAFDPSSGVKFSLFGSRPQAVIFNKVQVDNFPKDIQAIIKRDPTGKSFTPDEIKRIEEFQLQPRDSFTAPGFLSTESEIVTTAKVLSFDRTATTIISGRRVPIFAGKTSNVADSVPSTAPSSTSSSQFRVSDGRVVNVALSDKFASTASIGSTRSNSLSSDDIRSVSSTSVDSRPSSEPVSSSESLSTQSLDFTSSNANPASSSPSSQSSDTASSSQSTGRRSTSRSSDLSSQRSTPSTPRTPSSTSIPSTPRPPSTPSRVPRLNRTPPRVPTRLFSSSTPRPPRVLRTRPGKSKTNRLFTLFTKRNQDAPFTATTIRGESLADVAKRAQQKISTTAKASFKIKDETGKSVDPDEILNLISFGKFTRGKTAPDSVVEKAEFRIDSPGELKEITFKGQRANKIKGLFGGNK